MKNADDLQCNAGILPAKRLKTKEFNANGANQFNLFFTQSHEAHGELIRVKS